MTVSTTGAISGHDAAVAGGEGLEEATKSLVTVLAAVQAEGKTGLELAVEVAKRLDYGKIIGKTGAHLASRKIAEAIAGAGGFKDPASKFATILIVENMLAGAAVAGVDKLAANLADPAKIDTHLRAAVAKVMPTTASPKGGIVALTYHWGSKGAVFTHKAKKDGAGNIVPFPGQEFANTECGCMADDFREHSLTYPTTSKGVGKRKDGTVIPSETVQGHKFLVDGLTDVVSALRAKPVLCPHCFPQFAASVATASAGDTFWQKVGKNDAVKNCLAAMRRYAANHPRSHIAVDHLEDIAKLDFDALRILCESFHGRLIPVPDPIDPDKAIAYDMDDSMAKEFVIGLDSIGTELKFSHKAEEVANNAFEGAKKALQKGGLLGFGLLLLAVALPVTYVLWAVATVYVYGLGWFAPEGWWFSPTTVSAQAMYLFLSCVSVLIWLVPWYTFQGLAKAFGGLIQSKDDGHGYPSLAGTARSIAALLLGFASILIIGKGIGAWSSEGFPLMELSAAAMLATVAYDRIAAKWGSEESILHLAIKIARNNIRTLSAIGGATMAFIATIGVYLNWAEDHTSFRLAVERKIVGGQVVYVIPTPSGTVFRAEDVLGKFETERIVKEMSNARAEVCLPLGADIDLPGYYEKETIEACGGQTNATGFVIRKRLAHDLLVKVWGSTEYASAAELLAGEKTSKEALTEAVAALKDKPVPTKAAETISAPAPAKAEVNVATVRPAPVVSDEPLLDKADVPCYLTEQGC